jgi:hypothetical protein
MLKWLLQNIEVVAVVVLFAAQMVRALVKARQTAKSEEKREVAPQNYDEERRVREVQEQIRRQIAARRGVQPSTATPPVLTPPAAERVPVPRPETTQMPEPFGGPLGRMLEELQRKAQPPAPPPSPPPVVVARSNAAELERQQRIADELKAVEEARLVVKRRAAHVATDKESVAQSEPALRSAAHDRLIVDLRDVQSLRRAIVLREVLGTPVGLR